MVTFERVNYKKRKQRPMADWLLQLYSPHVLAINFNPGSTSLTWFFNSNLILYWKSFLWGCLVWEYNWPSISHILARIYRILTTIEKVISQSLQNQKIQGRRSERVDHLFPSLTAIFQLNSPHVIAINLNSNLSWISKSTSEQTDIRTYTTCSIGSLNCWTKENPKNKIN